MIIRGNGLAILNQLKRTERATRQTFGTLSSGKRITKAADDAAGLAIREKLRGVMRGSLQAVRNIQDAQSLLATADGAMMEMSEIVQRMRELTIQAMNAPLTDVHTGADSDTAIIQKEIDALKRNLADIVAQTEFNTQPLLMQPNAASYTYESKQQNTQLNVSTNRTDVQAQYVHNMTGEGEAGFQVEVAKMEGRIPPISSNIPAPPTTERLTTVDDHRPRFSEDGQTIIFQSTRDGGQYAVPLAGGTVVENSDTPLLQRTTAGSYRLAQSGSTLVIERQTSSGRWTRHSNVSSSLVNGNDYTFGPSVRADGTIDLVYRDSNFNISARTFNTQTGELSDPTELIPSDDVLNLPPKNNTVQLQSPPKLYEMNEEGASLVVKKKGDSGERTLTYWDGVGTPPEREYYTVNGRTIEFFGEAMIDPTNAATSEDDAQDLYIVQYVSDRQSHDYYEHSISDVTNFYNVHGEEGPMSLKVSVEGKTVPREHFLAERPDLSTGEQPDGIYVDEQAKRIYFYGTYRPKANEEIDVQHIKDTDGAAGVHTVVVPKNMPLYNLQNEDLATERALRVYVGTKEIKWDDKNGYVYDEKTGRVHLYGEARPDLSAGERVTVLYIEQRIPNEEDFYEIQLSKRPQLYNLEEGELASIAIKTSKGRVIPYDPTKTNGYYYNEETNRIELYGTARPQVAQGALQQTFHEQYNIQYIHRAEDVFYSDDKVEIKFDQSNADFYGMEEGSIDTIELTIGDTVIPYDATKTNGFIYNATTKRFEIYGEYRPKASDIEWEEKQSGPDKGKIIVSPNVTYRYVKEKEQATIGNNRYDLNLPTSTAVYGLEEESPRSIRVYYKGMEIPYDEENGFIVNEETKQVQLTGQYRPVGADHAKDFEVKYFNESSLSTSVSHHAVIHEVRVNGQVIEEATAENPNGYHIQNGRITLVGDARPDVEHIPLRWEVDYYDGMPIHLPAEGSTIDDDFHCEHEVGGAMPGSEVVEDSIVVYLNGKELAREDYDWNGSNVIVHYDRLSLQEHNTIHVEYDIRTPDAFDNREFIFQVGPNKGHHVTASIRSFNTMLKRISPVCVLEYDHAEKSLGRLDEAIQFISTELGNVGALTNRLEHTDANVQIVAEQLMSALSRIEDADMAKAKMEEVKLSILQQAQQIALVQHNTTQSEVLQLLK